MPDPIVLYEDTEDEIRIPARNEVCGRCGGDGTHDCFDGGMTQSEMAEEGPEFFEDYMAGHYSVPCSECHGRKVVAAPDEARCTPEQLKAWQDYERDEAEDRAISAMERRMGA